MRKHMTILGISGKQRIKLDVFVNFLKKKPLFLHFKTTTFFLFHFTVLKECNTFESNSESFSPSWSLQPTNSCFTSLKAISGPPNHAPLLYKLLVLLL